LLDKAFAAVTCYKGTICVRIEANGVVPFLQFLVLFSLERYIIGDLIYTGSM